MARAKGFNARLRLGWEQSYGTPPAGNWAELPFASIEHGATQGLIASELLGTGRDPLEPARDVIVVEGEATVPVDVRNAGHWLKGAFGAPVTTNRRAEGRIAFASQPASNATITLNGTVWTFVAGSPTGNQTQIGGSLAATLTALASDLNGSADAEVSKCSYAATATELVITHDAPGATGNAFTLAASTSPASNGTVSAVTLDGGGFEHLFRSGGPRRRGVVAFAGQPASNATLTLGGVTWTFKSASPGANETLIGASLAETLANLARDLNAAANATIARATYGATASALTIEIDEAGPNAAPFTVACSTSPASNATIDGQASASLTFVDGLPSFAAEIALADADEPTFYVTAGNKVSTLALDFQRSGQTQMRVGLMGQGEMRNGSSSAGAPAAAAVTRFSQFQGSIRKGGQPIANVTSATLEYANGLEGVPTIRDDGKVEGVDEGGSSCVGRIDARFANPADLVVPAEAGSAIDIELAYTRSATERLAFTLIAVRLPRPKLPITGPAGIQQSYDWQGERSGDWMLQVVLRNDVESY